MNLLFFNPHPKSLIHHDIAEICMRLNSNYALFIFILKRFYTQNVLFYFWELVWLIAFLFLPFLNHVENIFNFQPTTRKSFSINDDLSPSTLLSCFKYRLILKIFKRAARTHFQQRLIELNISTSWGKNCQLKISKDE